MERYQYILLDWDGNLAKTLDVWLNALRVPLESRGHFLDDKEIGADFVALRDRLEAHGYSGVDSIISEADTIATKMAPSVELYPDALEVLEALHKAGKKTALVTTSEHAYIDPLLKKYGMDRLFDAIVCGDDVEYHKPNPEPILRAISILNADPARTIMIGDSAKDIIGAQNAGIDSILFYPPGHERFFNIEHLQNLKPSYIVNDFRDVLSIVS